MNYGGSPDSEWAPRADNSQVTGFVAGRGGVNQSNVPVPRPPAQHYNSNSPSSTTATPTLTSTSRTSSFFSSFRKNSHEMDKAAGSAGPGTLTSTQFSSNPGYAQTYDPSQKRPDAGQWDEYGRPKSMILAGETGSLQGRPAQGRTISGPSKLVSPRAQAMQNSSSSSNSVGRRGSSYMKSLPTNASNGTIHPEIQQVVGLTVAHSSKVYCSGPLVRRIERNPDGTTVKDAQWVDVWAQLGGTTLSVWDMEAIKKASEEGREEPPTYINVTDSHVQVLGSVMNAATTTSPEQRHSNVVTINTAGSNLILFACPTPQTLLSWATALRLASWEKSRIEEIYTGHLFRLSMMEGNQFREPESTLRKGKLEGWAKIRISGSTEWQRIWMVVTTTSQIGSMDSGRPGSPSGSVSKKNRLSGFLGGKSSGSNHGHSGSSIGGPAILMYLGNKPKDKKKILFTTTRVTQAFAVYPERPEVINASSLFKVEGTIKDEQAYSSAPMRERGGDSREGYALIIPEVETGKAGSGEMIKWLIAIHDAFRMYGRPEGYSWNPRDPRSMFFTYPYGPYRDHLFLDRELAEVIDPRIHEVSRVRGAYMNILLQRMQAPSPTQQAPPPTQQALANSGPQLPPLNFNGGPIPSINGEAAQGMSGLATIREQSTFSADSQPAQPPPHDFASQQPAAAPNQILSHYPRQSPQQPPSASYPGTINQGNGSPAFNARPSGSPAPASPANPSTPIRQDSGGNPRRSPGAGSEQSGRPMASPLIGASVGVRGTQTPPRPSADMNPRTASPLSIRNSSDPVVRGQSPGNQQLPSIPSLRNPSGGIQEARTRQNQPPPAKSWGPPSGPPPTQASNQWGQQGASSSASQLATRKAETSEAQLYNEPGTLYMLSQIEDEPPEVSPVRDQPTQPLPPRLLALEKQRQNSANGIDDAEPSPYATNSNQPSPFASTGSVAAYNNQNVNVFSSAFASGSGSSGGGPGNVSPGEGLGPTTGTGQVLAHNPTYQHNGQTATSPLPMSAKSIHEQDDDLANADALAALTFAESTGEPETVPKSTARQPPKEVSRSSSESDSDSRGKPHAIRSSFAPNPKSLERQANADARQAATRETRAKPGRANGKATGKGRAAWASSDEEEEEEEEEEPSDDEQPAPVPTPQESKPANIISPQPQPHPSHPTNMSELTHIGNQYSSESRSGPSRRLPAIPTVTTQGPEGGRVSVPHTPDPPPRSEQYHSAYGHPSRPSSSDPQAHRKQPLESFDEASRRAQAERQQVQTLPNRPMWSTVLDPRAGDASNKTNQRDTFVTIEPNETMTTAFTPQGLLQAGIQDKQNRSAKQQEAHARETGASLINVPAPPPPPQMGLVGAITAHQREREREGGVGAALTERERERRLAEERQRQYDELQRRQLDQAKSMGGMDMPQGFNPMMMNPMFGWGMPMMYPGMGWGGMSPQQQQQQYQMLAAQQAAMQAYQQTMINLSQAGSQAPSDAGGTPETGANQRASSPMGWGMPSVGSPMMSPMVVGGIMPGMGMMPGMMPGYGMGGSGFLQPPGGPARSPSNEDPNRLSMAHTPIDSPQAHSLDPSKPTSRENYAS